MAPVERTKWMTSTWDCTLDHNCVHWASRLTMDCSGDLVFAVELLWTLFHKLLPPPTPPPALGFPPAHPLSHTGPKLARTSKNDLKWPEIKKVTNSKLYYKVNILLSPVLQNIVGPTRAKAGYTK